MPAARYAGSGYTARYLEAEWGDFMLTHAQFPNGLSEPFQFQDRNVRFYSSVVQMLRENLQDLPGFTRSRIADVGSASGRLVRELCVSFADLADVQGFEPSANLCELARQMVLGEPLPPRLPVSDLPAGGLLWLEVTPQLRQAVRCVPAERKAKFFEASAESADVPSQYFDVVCCLNVLDRHPDPQALVQALYAMTRRDGFLCISSPLEWQEPSTPKEHWRDSVTDFLDAADWQRIDERNIDYQFRVNNRQMAHYSSQVVLAKRIS
ncbi:MAG: methyltransferase domain-containing protein [Pseudomonadota bacterium]